MMMDIIDDEDCDSDDTDDTDTYWTLYVPGVCKVFYIH